MNWVKFAPYIQIALLLGRLHCHLFMLLWIQCYTWKCSQDKFICPLSCLTTHTVAACISVCFFMRNGDKEAERERVSVCACARSCISASPRVCILVFKLTHPDTAQQRLGPHVNVCHLKLLIFQRWLIFFLPLAVMRSLWVLNIPLIELICSLLPHVISVQLLKCLMSARSWPLCQPPGNSL